MLKMSNLSVYELGFINEFSSMLKLKCHDEYDLTEMYEGILHRYYITKSLTNEIMLELTKKLTYKFVALSHNMTRDNSTILQERLNELALHYERNMSTLNYTSTTIPSGYNWSSYATTSTAAATYTTPSSAMQYQMPISNWQRQYLPTNNYPSNEPYIIPSFFAPRYFPESERIEHHKWSNFDFESILGKLKETNELEKMLYILDEFTKDDI